MQDIYAISALPSDKIQNEWDIFTTSAPVLAADQSFELLIEGAVGGKCSFSG